jgi:membrane protein implicated in regulation of membrane protease activity
MRWTGHLCVYGGLLLFILLLFLFLFILFIFIFIFIFISILAASSARRVNHRHSQACHPSPTMRRCIAVSNVAGDAARMSAEGNPIYQARQRPAKTAPIFFEGESVRADVSQHPAAAALG